MLRLLLSRVILGLPPDAEALGRSAAAERAVVVRRRTGERPARHTCACSERCWVTLSCARGCGGSKRPTRKGRAPRNARAQRTHARAAVQTGLSVVVGASLRRNRAPAPGPPVCDSSAPFATAEDAPAPHDALGGRGGRPALRDGEGSSPPDSSPLRTPSCSNKESRCQATLVNTSGAERGKTVRTRQPQCNSVFSRASFESKSPFNARTSSSSPAMTAPPAYEAILSMRQLSYGSFRQ